MKFRYILASLLLVVPVASFADTTGLGTGYVTSILTMNQGAPPSTANIFMFETTTYIQKAACNVRPRWAVDLNNPGGIAIMKTVMTASSRHKQINVYGAGACTVYPDSENVVYITMDVS